MVSYETKLNLLHEELLKLTLNSHLNDHSGAVEEILIKINQFNYSSIFLTEKVANSIISNLIKIIPISNDQLILKFCILVINFLNKQNLVLGSHQNEVVDYFLRILKKFRSFEGQAHSNIVFCLRALGTVLYKNVHNLKDTHNAVIEILISLSSLHRYTNIEMKNIEYDDLSLICAITQGFENLTIDEENSQNYLSEDNCKIIIQYFLQVLQNLRLKAYNDVDFTLYTKTVISCFKGLKNILLVSHTFPNDSVNFLVSVIQVYMIHDQSQQSASASNATSVLLPATPTLLPSTSTLLPATSTLLPATSTCLIDNHKKDYDNPSTDEINNTQQKKFKQHPQQEFQHQQLQQSHLHSNLQHFQTTKNSTSTKLLPLLPPPASRTPTTTTFNATTVPSLSSPNSTRQEANTKLTKSKKNKKKRSKAKLVNQQLNSPNNFDQDSDNDQQQQSQRPTYHKPNSSKNDPIKPDLTPEDVFWSTFGVFDSSDYSDNETSSQSYLSGKSHYVNKIKTHTLTCFHVAIKYIDKKTMFGLWSQLIPESFVGHNVKLVDFPLFALIVKDQSYKIRLASLSILTSLLDGSKQFLMAAEDGDQYHNVSYTPFSVTLGGMVKELHRCLLHVLSKEQVFVVIVQTIKCLGVLVSNSPYHRLKPGLLSRTVKVVRPFLSHRDANIRVVCLTCLGSVVAVQAPLAEVMHILDSKNKLHSGDGISNSHLSFSDLKMDRLNLSDCFHMNAMSGSGGSGGGGSSCSSVSSSPVPGTPVKLLPVTSQHPFDPMIPPTRTQLFAPSPHDNNNNDDINASNDDLDAINNIKSTTTSTPLMTSKVYNKNLINNYNNNVEMSWLLKACVEIITHTTTRNNRSTGSISGSSSSGGGGGGSSNDESSSSSDVDYYSATTATRSSSIPKLTTTTTTAPLTTSGMPPLTPTTLTSPPRPLPSTTTTTITSTLMSKPPPPTAPPPPTTTTTSRLPLTKPPPPPTTTTSSTSRLPPTTPATTTTTTSAPTTTLRTKQQHKHVTPVRVEALQLMTLVTKHYFVIVKLHLPCLQDLILFCFRDNDQSIQLHACKLLLSLSSSITVVCRSNGPAIVMDQYQHAWSTLLDGPVQQLMSSSSSTPTTTTTTTADNNNNDDNEMVVMTMCECLGYMGQEVFAGLPTHKRIFCITMMLGLTSDPSPHVRVGALSAIGRCLDYPCLREDECFLMDATTCLISCSKDSNLPVVLKAAWSLSNLTDALLLNGDDTGYPSSMLLDLFVTLCNLCVKHDKPRSNALRALGNLLKFIPKPFIESGKFKEVVDTSLKLIINHVTTGSAKVRWNACYAYGKLMKNDHAFSNVDPILKKSAFKSLIQTLKTCKNFKVKISAATVLGSPTNRNSFIVGQSHSDGFGLVEGDKKGLGNDCVDYYICVLETMIGMLLTFNTSKFDYLEMKFADTFVKKVLSNLMRLLTLSQLNDLENVYDLVKGHGEDFKGQIFKVINEEESRDGGPQNNPVTDAEEKDAGDEEKLEKSLKAMLKEVQEHMRTLEGGNVNCWRHLCQLFDDSSHDNGEMMVMKTVGRFREIHD